MKTIALELEKYIVQTVEPHGKVIFDQLILQKGDVEYDYLSGDIKIDKIGRYSISWNITTQASVGSKDITFAIEASTGEKFAASSPVKIGELTGFAILQVDKAPISLALVSKQENAVQLSLSTSVKAQLIIGELLESNVGEPGELGPPGPPGPPGIWESGGLQLLSTSPAAGEEITIASGEVIPFDNIVLQFNGVTYSQNTIKISEIGHYLITWEFIAKAEPAGDIIICLQDMTSMPKIHGKSGSKSQDYTTISGSALVMVSNIMLPYSFDLQLINYSGIPIKLTAASNRASSAVSDTSTNFTSSLTVIKMGDIYWS